MSVLKNAMSVPLIAGFALMAALPVMQGCTKNENNAASAPGAAAPSAANDPTLIASGKTVFDANGCARCHSGGGRAPDLSHVGADPSHTPEWLAQHVKNP